MFMAARLDQTGRSPAGRPSHFLAMASMVPSLRAAAMISLTLAFSLSSPLAMPTKQGAVLEQQLVLGVELRVLLHHVAGHGGAGGQRLRLARDERGDGGVVVLEALVVQRGGRDLGQLLVFHGATRDGHRLAAHVGKGLDVQALGREHGLEEGRVGRREVDDLLALRVLAQRGDHQVGLLGLQVRNAVGAGDGHQFDLHAQLGGDELGHFHVEALRLHVLVDRAVGRIVGGHGDLDGLGLEHVVECVLGLGGAGGGQHGNGSHCERELAFGRREVHSSAPR
jgi:hypothetical protein